MAGWDVERGAGDGQVAGRGLETRRLQVQDAVKLLLLDQALKLFKRLTCMHSVHHIQAFGFGAACAMDSLLASPPRSYSSLNCSNDTPSIMPQLCGSAALPLAPKATRRFTAAQGTSSQGSRVLIHNHNSDQKEIATVKGKARYLCLITQVSAFTVVASGTSLHKHNVIAINLYYWLLCKLRCMCVCNGVSVFWRCRAPLVAGLGCVCRGSLGIQVSCAGWIT